MEYTEAVHASMLLRILNMPHPCGECPSHEFRTLCDEKLSIGTQCNLCKGFIDMPKPYSVMECPCFEIGKEECIKRTWLALEEKGYI